MKIISNTVDFYLEENTAACIGKFDGVHLGHRRLLEEILRRKQDGLKACVFTFDPPPAVFFGVSDGKELTTREEKRALFEQMGVDILIEFPMNAETARTPAETFAEEILARRMRVKFLAAGNDLSFGDKGAGNVALLQKLAPKLDFEIEIIDKVRQDMQIVSSTLVREKVEVGNMNRVHRLLGMPYMVSGEVVQGNRIGRTLGFPTLNVVPGATKLLPPNGVYFSETVLDGKRYRSISNVGKKPTIGENYGLNVETYLYDYDGDAYGKKVDVYLYEFRRPEMQFEGLEALKSMLQQDILVGSTYKPKV